MSNPFNASTTGGLVLLLLGLLFIVAPGSLGLAKYTCAGFFISGVCIGVSFSFWIGVGLLFFGGILLYNGANSNYERPAR